MRAAFTKYVCLGVAAVACVALPARADEPTRPWSDQAELGLVFTTGNSETQNFAASNKYKYTMDKSEFTFDASVLRLKTTARSVSFNTDTEQVDVDKTTRLTAEQYSLAGKYRYTFREGFFGYATAGWLQNRFAGLDSRMTAGVGVGYRFIKDDVQTLTGEAGIDYTKDKLGAFDADQNFEKSDTESYAGARQFLGYERKISASSKFNGEFELHENLSDTTDMVARLYAGITASLTSKVALKAGYTVLYDRQPPVVVLDNEFPKKSRFEFDKTDTIFQTSLVINF